MPLSRWEKWCHNCRHLDVNRCVDEQGWKSVSSCGSTFIGIRFLTPTPPTATWLCKFQFLFFAFHFGPSQPQVYTCSRFGFELFYRGVTWLNGVWMAMASKSHGQWFDIISRLCVCVCVRWVHPVRTETNMTRVCVYVIFIPWIDPFVRELFTLQIWHSRTCTCPLYFPEMQLVVWLGLRHFR